MDDDLLSPQDAAALAGVPAAQLLRWIAEQPRLRDGEAFRGPGIRYVGPRHRPRFRREDVEGWRDRQRKRVVIAEFHYVQHDGDPVMKSLRHGTTHI